MVSCTGRSCGRSTAREEVDGDGAGRDGRWRRGDRGRGRAADPGPPVPHLPRAGGCRRPGGDPERRVGGRRHRRARDRRGGRGRARARLRGGSAADARHRRDRRPRGRVRAPSWRDRGVFVAYEHTGFVHPDVRRRGLGRALLRHQATALRRWPRPTRRRARAAATPDAPRAAAPADRVLFSWADTRRTGAMALLDSEGYVPVRWYLDLERPSLDDLPAGALPPGIEMRAPDPAGESILRAALAAEDEAFRDHWGHHAMTDEDADATLAEPDLDPRSGGSRGTATRSRASSGRSSTRRRTPGSAGGGSGSTASPCAARGAAAGSRGHSLSRRWPTRVNAA